MSLTSMGLISGGFGLLNGIVGAFGQSSANKAMLKATRETNEQNYKIWQEQKQHNVDMFNKQNDANMENWWTQFNATNLYNDPSAQRARLEEAGLNPYMMMNGGSSSAGIASSSGVPSAQAQPAQAPTMQAPPSDAFTSPAVVGLQQSLAGLQKMSEMLYASQLTDSEKAKLPIALRAMEADAKVGELEAKMKDYDWTSGNYHSLSDSASKLARSNADLAFNESMISDLTLGTQVDIQRSTLANMNATLALTMCDVEAKTIINKYLDTNQQQQLALQVGELAMQIKQQQLTDAQIEEAISRIASNYAQVGWFNAQSRMFDSQTRLNNQMYNFNEAMNPLLIEQQGLLNTGFGLQNTGYEWQNKTLEQNWTIGDMEYQFKKSLIPSMLKAAGAKYSYDYHYYNSGASFFSNPSNANDYWRFKSGKYDRGSSSGGFNIGLGPFGSANWQYGKEDGY